MLRILRALAAGMTEAEPLMACSRAIHCPFRRAEEMFISKGNCVVL